MKKTVEELLAEVSGMPKYFYTNGVYEYVTITEVKQVFEPILSELSRLQSENDELRKRLTNK